MPRVRSSRRGMTLVEVLIVIAILTVLMSVLSIGAISMSSVSSSGYDVLEVPAPSALVPEGGNAPVLEAVTLDLLIDSRPALDGLTVGTRYEVDIDATFQIRSPVLGPVQLRFPFPDGVADVRGVELALTDPGGAPAGGQVHYGLTGLSWSGTLPADQPHTARLRYTAEGRDTLSLSLSDGRQPLRLRATASLPGAPPVVIPEDAIQPTSRTDDTLRWELDGLLSDAPITLALPAGGSMLGHLAAVGRLAALGVALFGAGFWYLSEGVQPGRLDDFRLGGLLLLTLNYGLFYAIFFLICPTIGAALAVPIAAGISWPLLTIHVARITDRSFARRRALPLAVASTALVLALAYADGQRPLVGLAGVIAATTLVTTTWRRWSEGRRSWQQREERSQRLQRRRLELQRQREALREALTTASGHLSVARRIEEEAPDGLGPERAEVLRRLGRLEATAARAEHLLTPLPEVPAASIEQLGTRHAEITRAIDALQDQAQALQGASDTLERAGAVAIEALFSSMAGLQRALEDADLAEVEAQAVVRHAQPRLRSEAEAHLEDLVALRQATVTLSARVSTPGGRDLRAQANEARRLTQATEQLAARVRQAITQLSEARAVARPGEAALHCPGCGHPHPEQSRFCSACGLQRPIARPCGACGHINRLPAHLLREGWEQTRLHCASCGAGVGPSAERSPTAVGA